MDEDLKFRYQKHDGRNAAIVAVASIIAVPVIATIGWAAAFLIAGATIGALAYHFKK
jgi:hypothetical protein